MRRWLARIAICLVLGVLTTVVVTWAIAMETDFRNPPAAATGPQRYDTPSDQLCWSFSTWRRVLVTQVVSSVWGRFPADDAEHLHARGSRVGHDKPPMWTIMRRPKDFTFEDLIILRFEERAFGWPMRAMRYEKRSRLTSVLRLVVIGGLEIPPQGQRFGPGPFLPTNVIWSGLLLNTVFYAGVWCVLLIAPNMAAGCLRRRRGVCPTCGYDLRGNLSAGCPECGWRREAAS